ncbi:MAG TPA: tryptophan synthase subunit alpha [Candidatus Binataceae bacterium]|nr:tryptophan synthase subunit alpha [Candidatus Binataceae bacterium]
MAGRIEKKFHELGSRGEAALIPFVFAGDPDLERTRQIVLELESRGADLIELGVPFSDPMADGPANQRAGARALNAGASVAAILGLVSDLRKDTAIPIVLFGYYNPILQYGPERFAADAARAGADGCLVVDLPPEEADELKRPARDHGIDLIYLLAPTTPIERARRIVRSASGFLYYVSVTGVTGTRTALDAELEPRVRELKTITRLPIGVGFGISTVEQAARVASFAAAVVVGSAFSLLIEAHPEAPEVAVGELAGAMKAAMRATAASAPDAVAS